MEATVGIQVLDSVQPLGNLSIAFSQLGARSTAGGKDSIGMNPSPGGRVADMAWLADPELKLFLALESYQANGRRRGLHVLGAEPRLEALHHPDALRSDDIFDRSSP
ncbi:MAG: hypothetical protein AAGG01_07750 [Planctomycetota bacterium]